MSPLIKKEIRLMLPAWLAALAVVVVLPPFLQFLFINSVPYNPDILPAWFGLGCLFISLAAFGQEFSSRTFLIQLSQPIERSRIWRTKVIILAAASISILLVLFVCYKVYFRLFPVYRIPFPFKVLTIGGFVIVSGGLWTTLLFRRLLEAFWITLLAPVAILLPVGTLSNHFHWPNVIGAGVLVVYSIAGFLWARRLFLRAQDARWTGGEIELPSRKRGLERAMVSANQRHWLSALVWKELQLHQVNLLIAVVVLVLDLASVLIRKVHPYFADPNVQGILELIWALWLLMPLLIGGAAVAEEHRSGTFESQLCLPVSRRTQFFIKFSVALVLSMILGGVMPFVIERTHDFNNGIFIIAAATFFVSFYASTLARATLQAIGLTIIFILAIYACMVIIAFHIFRPVYSFPGRLAGLEWLKLHLGVPIILLTVGGLMYWNFKWLHQNAKLLWRNGIVIFAALIFISAGANAVYFRSWELLTPVEPLPGPARLDVSNEVKFAVDNTAIYILTPGQRLWAEAIRFQSQPVLRLWRGTREILIPGQSQFFGDSNWVSVTADKFQAIAIQTNGSLWSFEKNSLKQGGFKQTQIGSETKWVQAAGGSMGFLLLKKNGSLWAWGTNAFQRNGPAKWVPAAQNPDLTSLPVCLSEETNWTKVFTTGLLYQRSAKALKNDNSVWKLSVDWRKTRKETNCVTRLRRTNLEEWRHFVSLGGFGAGIKTNGELWYFQNKWVHNKYFTQEKMQLGRGAKWKAVGFTTSSIIAIRSDGTLWKWPYFWVLPRNGKVTPVQLGKYSDWITLLSIPHQYVAALAADGSLWLWDAPSRYVWLAKSRKPVYLGNIFGKTN